MPGVCRIRWRILIDRRKLEAWIAEGCPERPSGPGPKRKSG